MPKPKPNPARERRIIDEIVVDAYNEEERAMGWHCYLEEKLAFPFKARCIAPRTISPLNKGEEVEVSSMARSDDCMRDDAEQARIATGILSAGDVFVPKTVILELEWVLRSVAGAAGCQGAGVHRAFACSSRSDHRGRGAGVGGAAGLQARRRFCRRAASCRQPRVQRASDL